MQRWPPGSPGDRKRDAVGRSGSPAVTPGDRKRDAVGRSGSPAVTPGDRKRDAVGRSGSPAVTFVGKVLSWLIPQAISVMCLSCSTAASHCSPPR